MGGKDLSRLEGAGPQGSTGRASGTVGARRKRARTRGEWQAWQGLGGGSRGRRRGIEGRGLRD